MVETSAEQRFDGKSWSVLIKRGEPSDPLVVAWLFDVLEGGADPKSAKIFQGSSGGEVATFIVQKF